ncbi:MAG: winged helix-turn-helix transcriptional regulator [Methanomassiliicoccales archaeon]|nr:MAG: winged helix-turn-helix transcriptional regulator [Methanomassiliicoccales archaeon]
MPEKIGDALKRAITQERAVEDVKEKKKEESLLMNPTRLAIFQYLCKNPCSKLRAVAQALELAVPTVDWHLKKLVERGLVTSKKVGKNKIFYPAEMIDSEDVEVLALFTQDKAKLIISTIAGNPGIAQGELGKKLDMYQQEVGWYTSKLTEKGVLSRTIDGRFRRYYLSENLGDVLRSNRKRKNLFKKTLLKALKSDGTNPEIIRGRGETLVIQIGSGKEKYMLKVNLNLIPSFLTNEPKSTPNLG